MKFQSLEQSSGVSIFQEYVIGLNSSLEKNFIKLEYHYKQSLAFCSYTYRPSNLFKIGVIIYSNMILLMLKSCSGYIYDCFLCLVLHLMGFHGFWCSMVLIFLWESRSNCWERTSRWGSPEVDVTAIAIFLLKQHLLLFFLPSQWVWTRGQERNDVYAFNSVAVLYWDIWFETLFSW